MGTISKSVNTDSSNVEVKADGDVGIQCIEIQTVTSHCNRIIPFPDNSRNIESAEVTEQLRVPDHSAEVVGKKTIGRNLNPAHARWLAIGEKIGALLSRFKA